MASIDNYNEKKWSIGRLVSDDGKNKGFIPYRNSIYGMDAEVRTPRNVSYKIEWYKNVVGWWLRVNDRWMGHYRSDFFEGGPMSKCAKSIAFGGEALCIWDTRTGLKGLKELNFPAMGSGEDPWTRGIDMKASVIKKTPHVSKALRELASHRDIQFWLVPSQPPGKPCNEGYNARDYIWEMNVELVSQNYGCTFLYDDAAQKSSVYFGGPGGYEHESKLREPRYSLARERAAQERAGNGHFWPYRWEHGHVPFFGPRLIP
jgi:hypothetical protein